MALVQLEVVPQSQDAPPGATGVAVITLNDPDKRNMLSDQMVVELIAVLDDVESRSDVGAVVVTGAGRAFCAGANLGNLGRAGEAARSSEASPAEAGPDRGNQPDPGPAAGADPDIHGPQGRSMRGIYEAFLRFSRSPLPTLAAVNGAAVGAGMNLALACDVRVTSHSSRFDTRFLELGLHPGGGHTWMLQQIVGPQTAAAMVLFGQILNGQQAVERGLAWLCVEDDQLLDTAKEMAGKAASAPLGLARRAKATMTAVRALDDHDAAVDTELSAQLWSLGQPFFAERLAAVQRRISGNPRS